MVFYRKRFNRAGLPAEKLIGRLSCAIGVHASAHTLLQRTHTAIAHMSAVVVVTEENCAADKILRADRHVMRPQDLHPGLITLRPVYCASTVSVFRDHYWLAGKCRV